MNANKLLLLRPGSSGRVLGWARAGSRLNPNGNKKKMKKMKKINTNLSKKKKKTNKLLKSLTLFYPLNQNLCWNLLLRMTSGGARKYSQEGHKNFQGGHGSSMVR